MIMKTRTTKILRMMFVPYASEVEGVNWFYFVCPSVCRQNRVRLITYFHRRDPFHTWYRYSPPLECLSYIRTFDLEVVCSWLRQKWCAFSVTVLQCLNLHDIFSYLTQTVTGMRGWASCNDVWSRPVSIYCTNGQWLKQLCHYAAFHS